MDLMNSPGFKIIVLGFLIGFLVFSFWPKFISPEVEVYRKEKNLIELQKDYELLNSVKFPDKFFGFQTLVDGGVASFSGETQKKLDEVGGRIRFWQRRHALPELKKLADLNFSLLLSAKDLLTIFRDTLSYLQKIEPPIKFLNEGIEEFGSGGYAKLIEKPQIIREKREESERLSREFKMVDVPPELGEFNKQLEKALQAQVDFWANNEIAIGQRTPMIYHQSFWVLKGDWESLQKIGEDSFDIGQNRGFQRLKIEFEKKLESLGEEFKKHLFN